MHAPQHTDRHTCICTNIPSNQLPRHKLTQQHKHKCARQNIQTHMFNIQTHVDNPPHTTTHTQCVRHNIQTHVFSIQPQVPVATIHPHTSQSLGHIRVRQHHPWCCCDSSLPNYSPKGPLHSTPKPAMCFVHLAGTFCQPPQKLIEGCLNPSRPNNQTEQGEEER